MFKNSSLASGAYKFALAIFVLLGTSGYLGASRKVVPSLDWLFEDSSFVAVIQIEKGEARSVKGNPCGIKYYGTVLQKFKGMNEGGGNRIAFGDHIAPVLMQGETYLVFLKYEDDPEAIFWLAVKERRERESLLEEMRGSELPDGEKLGDPESIKPLAIEQIKCNDLVPGFFNHQAAWQVRGSFVLLTTLPPAEMPETVQTTYGGGEWWFRKADLFSYLQALEDGRRPGSNDKRN